MNERRITPRHQLWLPVKVDALREGLAVTHDASEKGLLMVTASRLDPGSAVTVVLKAPDGTETHHLSGRVVRVEANTDDPLGLWPHRMAVEFDQPEPKLEWLIASLATVSGKGE